MGRYTNKEDKVMARRIKMERRRVRSAVLTLRMTNEEMLRFRLAAIAMGKKRARIVRDRLIDLIGNTVSPAGVGDSESVVPVVPVVAVDETVITGNTVIGCPETANELGK